MSEVTQTELIDFLLKYTNNRTMVGDDAKMLLKHFEIKHRCENKVGQTKSDWTNENYLQLKAMHIMHTAEKSRADTLEEVVDKLIKEMASPKTMDF